MNCCICNRDRKAAHTIVVTPEERAAVLQLTREAPPDSYSYCKACWDILTDKNQGAQLFRGLLRTNLRNSGVRNADALAEKYYQFLVDHAAKKPVS